MHRSKNSTHSITWSTRMSIDIGTSSPSAFAVFRLMMSSSFAACWTGRSAGFSPQRMRPAYTPTGRYKFVGLVP